MVREVPIVVIWIYHQEAQLQDTLFIQYSNSLDLGYKIEFRSMELFDILQAKLKMGQSTTLELRAL